MQKFILAAALALASAGAGAASQTVVNPAPIRTCATIQKSALDLIVKTEHGEEFEKVCETGTGKGWRYVLVAVDGMQ